MKNKKERGLLLMEALVALALLVTGVCAVSLAFSQTRDAMGRGEKKSALARCAQEKILEEISGAAISDICNETFLWTQSRKPISANLNLIRWTAQWKEKGTAHEETFELVR